MTPSPHSPCISGIRGQKVLASLDPCPPTPQLDSMKGLQTRTLAAASLGPRPWGSHLKAPSVHHEPPSEEAGWG